MPRFRAYLLLWVLALLGLVTGCAGPRAASAGLGEEQSIRSRATNYLARAGLLKPEQSGQPGALDPLLMIEEAGPTNAPLPGMVSLQGERWFVDTTQPVLYTNLGVSTINGKPYPRHVFVWFSTTPGSGSHFGSRLWGRPPVCPLAESPTPRGTGGPRHRQTGGLPHGGQNEDCLAPGESHLRPQGIAIILGASGLPILWEVLRDSSQRSIVYVAKSLEAAAAKAYGPVLTNRAFAVEKAPSESKGTVVARLLDDAPVAMGPIVNVAAETGDIAAVVCRCMPVQVQELISTSTYLTLPMDLLLASPAFPKAVGADLDRFIDHQEAGQRLENTLRFP